MKHPPPRPRQQLGAFLRARREQLRPEDFGLQAGQRRRTPGLRREEAALLCGVSPTWFTWIEQGRTTSISVPTLAAIARGLRMSRAERAHLFTLAARADPSPPGADRADPKQMQTLVDAVRTPAYLLDRHWDAVAWNRPARELFAHWLGAPRRSGEAASRNLLHFVFLEPAARKFIVNWSDRAQRLVAEFRADVALFPDDAVRQSLVDELAASSDEFAAAWRAQRVQSRDGGLRSFQHPARGRCHYEQFTLRVSQQVDLKLTVLVPATSGD